MRDDRTNHRTLGILLAGLFRAESSLRGRFNSQESGIRPAVNPDSPPPEPELSPESGRCKDP